MTKNWSPDHKTRNREEELLQCAVVDHLRTYGVKNCIWYAVPNGEHRSKTTGAKLKRMGVLAGVLDMAFILPDSRPAFIEFKADRGRLNEAQIAFCERLDAMQIEYLITNDLDQALSVLTAWGCLRTKEG